LLPTPTATYPGGTQENYLRRKDREADGFVSLNHVVALLPTPGANDATGGNHESMRDGAPGLRGLGQLLNGASTDTPSDDGSESSADPLRGQLTIEGA